MRVEEEESGVKCLHHKLRPSLGGRSEKATNAADEVMERRRNGGGSLEQLPSLSYPLSSHSLFLYLARKGLTRNLE